MKFSFFSEFSFFGEKSLKKPSEMSKIGNEDLNFDFFDFFKLFLIFQKKFFVCLLPHRRRERDHEAKLQTKEKIQKKNSKKGNLNMDFLFEQKS